MSYSFKDANTLTRIKDSITDSASSEVKSAWQTAWMEEKKPEIDQESTKQIAEYHEARHRNIALKKEESRKVASELRELEAKKGRLESQKVAAQKREEEARKRREEAARKHREEEARKRREDPNYQTTYFNDNTWDNSRYETSSSEYERQLESVRREIRENGYTTRQIERELERLNDTYQDELNIKRSVNDKFLNRFQRDEWPQLSRGFKEKLNKQLDAFKPEELLNQLLTKHSWLAPWLERESRAYNNGVVYEFLETTLKENLIQCLSSPASRGDWSNINGKELNNSNTNWSWKSLDADKLRREIEGYPYSAARKYFVTDPCRETKTYANEFQDNGTNFLIRRVDLIRYLSETESTLFNRETWIDGKRIGEGVYSLKRAPLHLKELSALSPAHWNHFDSLFVNLCLESTPFWALLYKNDGKWVAYLPAPEMGFEAENVQWERALRGVVPQFDRVVHVDYRTNQTLNDLAPNDVAVEWHAVMLEKVFMWCVKGEKKPLADYLQDTPISLMIEAAYSRCVGDSGRGHMTRSYVNRLPISDKKVPKLIEYEYHNNAQYLFNTDAFISCSGSRLLDEFRKGAFTVSADHHTLTARPIEEDQINQRQFVSAYHLVYHNEGFTRLAFEPTNYDTNFDKLSKEIADYDINLRSVRPLISRGYLRDYAQSYAHSMHCAARNRFMAQEPWVGYLNKSKEGILNRPGLWNAAGSYMLELFQKQGHNFDLDFMEQAIAFRSEWEKSYCDHEKRGELPDSLWSFVQVAQTGVPGLDVMWEQLSRQFEGRWRNPLDPIPADPMHITFDAMGSMTDRPIHYLMALSRKINQFRIDRAPLFKTMGLILPAQLDDAFLDQLVQLFRVVNQRQMQNAEDIPELKLFNVDITEPMSKKLIERVTELAEEEDLRCIISIPAWDRNSSADEKLGQLKAKYRAAQNQIIDNRRNANFKKLPENTEHLVKQINGKLEPGVILEATLARRTQAWNGEDVTYPLESRTNGDLGIQQQLQQQVQAEVVHEVQVQQEQEQEQELEIGRYYGNEKDLITRKNIEQKCRGSWNAVPASKKAYSGAVNGRELDQLFSLWVGSERDAQQVITHVEPAAIDKIMEFPAQFRLGLSRDNLPAGFYLATSYSCEGFILCYDDKTAREVLRKRATLPLKKRNPFTVELYKPREATPWHGDYRQCHFDRDARAQLTQWKFLALETVDPARTISTINALKAFKVEEAVAERDATPMMQHVDARRAVAKPGQYEQALKTLNAWAAECKISPDLRQQLFTTGSKNVLTEANLVAFGQLFNHFDVTNPKQQPVGSQYFLMLADEVLKVCGPENFAIWKSRVIDPSENWSECLDKSELDAMALSLSTLKDKPEQLAAWWKLVDAHGRSTGQMRYAQLWYGFQKLLYLMEHQERQSKIAFDLNAWNRYLTPVDNFNGAVFLDRLYSVLRAPLKSKQLYADQIQQDIMNHVDQIDWRHNGLYYAVRNNNYPYWTRELALTAFQATEKEAKANYLVDWSKYDKVTNPKAHLLRFASLRGKMTVREMKMLEPLVLQGFDAQDDANTYRLFMACLTLGVDHVEDLTLDEVKAGKHALNKDTLSLISSSIAFGERPEPGVLHLHWRDLSIFTSVFTKFSGYLSNLSTRDNELLKLINACGRALQYYRANELNAPAQLEALLKWSLASRYFSTSLHLNHIELMAAPWLLAEAQQRGETAFDLSYRTTEQDILIKQLQSIDFEKSRGALPTYDEVRQAFIEIKRVNQTAAAETRRRIVQGWTVRGCAVKFQDARFRGLTEAESKSVIEYLEAQMKPNFRALNLKLCEILVRTHLTVQADLKVSALKQLEPFLSLLVELDNKVRFNELGQILGMLVSSAKTSEEQPYYYSVPQLTTWLRALRDEEHFKDRHYPVEILEEILKHAKSDPNSSFMNVTLFKLNENTRLAMGEQKLIESIVKLDLPNQHKPGLAELILKSQTEEEVVFVQHASQSLLGLSQNEASAKFLTHVAELTVWVSRQPIDLPTRRAVFDNLRMYKELQLSERLLPLQERSQMTLMTLIKKGELSLNDVQQYFKATDADDPKAAFIKLILVQAFRKWSEDKDQIQALTEQLTQLSFEALEELAFYCSSDPRPTMRVLSKLVASSANVNDISNLIHRFETVEQGLTPTGESIRTYSVAPVDRENLLRVLRGMKLKGNPNPIPVTQANSLINLLYYANSYSQVERLDSIPLSELTHKLHEVLNEQKQLVQKINKSGNKEDEIENANLLLARARVQACMREICLRKTGLWPNRTQMIALLYASIYNDVSMLHQVRTGQGKSIITIMRTAYRALNGFVIDLYTSKDSLSERDHDDFAPVCDAMGIPHAHITPYSSAETYQIGQPGQIGAINYATMGNFSLFQSTHVWAGTKAILVPKEWRVAFNDEADHVWKDETTQFNFSDNRDSDTIYNLDEWVYRIAYEFYLEKRATFEAHDGRVSRNGDLQELCKRLQDSWKYAPKESRFFDKFIIPTLTADESLRPLAEQKRDQQLMQLLKAAHTAQKLESEIDFCVQDVLQPVYGGTLLKARFCKVVIQSQIREGSTYSDMVQQFLHVRMNHEAVERGERPNYFVEPLSQIALSMNAPYLLKNWYGSIEGCTGTAGDAEDLKHYEAEYGVAHVIKLPTHEPLKTRYLPTIYCDSEEEYIDELAKVILRHPENSTLVTCQHDVAVTDRAKKIKARLVQLGYEQHDKFVKDTNASGIREADILPQAGQVGAGTVSARLGRGTDIKPASKKLAVARSYPARPRTRKQEWGRQGRNGADGEAAEVIFYGEILRETQKLFKSPEYKKRFLARMDAERAHLMKKIAKHRGFDLPSTKFSWLENDQTLVEKYLTTRTLQQIQYELKEESEQFNRRKEYLLATLSGNIFSALLELIQTGDEKVHEDLCTNWLQTIKDIDLQWNARLANEAGDSDAVYNKFFANVQGCWDKLCASYPMLLNPMVTATLVKNIDEHPKELSKFGEYFDQQIEHWQSETPTLKELGRLEKLSTDVKKMLLSIHPDKEQDEAVKLQKTELAKKANALRGILKGHIDNLKPKYDMPAPPQTPVRGQAAEQNAEVPEAHALVVADFAQRNAAPVQADKDSTEQALDLYRQYVKGINEFYMKGDDAIDREKVTAIFGQSLHYLNELYRLLQVFTYELQPAARTRLFATLTQSMQQAPIYCVPAEHLLKSVLGVANLRSDEKETHCWSSFARFFEQVWLLEQTPKTTSIQDMEKNGALLELVMSVSRTAFVQADQAALKFIDRLTTQIHTHFWGKFSNPTLFSHLNKFFASSELLTTILMKHTNAQDVGYILKLLNNNTQNAGAEGRIDLIIRYFEENVATLETHPWVIRPLISIMLDASGFVPKPDCLTNRSEAVQNQFWHFLSKRSPLEQEPCEQLIQMANQLELSENFIEVVMTPLLGLPARVPVSYILEQLKFNPGKHHNNDCAPTMNAIHEAGVAFESFVASREVTLAERNDWDAVFKDLTPNESKFFFEEATQHPTVSTEVLRTVAKEFADHEVTLTQQVAKNALNLLDRCQALDEKTSGALVEYYAQHAHDPVCVDRVKQLIDVAATCQVDEILNDAVDKFLVKQEIDESQVKTTLKARNEFLLYVGDNPSEEWKQVSDNATSQFNQTFFETARRYPTLDKAKVLLLAQKIEALNMTPVTCEEQFKALERCTSFSVTHKLNVDQLWASNAGNPAAQNKILSFLNVVEGEDLGDAMSGVFNAYIFYGSMDLDDVRQVVQARKSYNKFHAQRVMDLKTKDEWQQTIRDMSPAQMIAFFDLARAQTSLEANDLLTLAKTFAANRDSIVIGTYSSILSLAARCAKVQRECQVTIMPNFAKMILQPGQQRRITQFLDHLESVNLDLDPMRALCKSYFESGKLKNFEDVKRAVVVTQEAIALNNSGKFAEVFAVNATPANQMKRERIMHHLHHGILDLGTTFNDKCFTEYANLADQLSEQAVNAPRTKSGTNVFQKLFQELRGFAEEVARVAGPSNQRARNHTVSTQVIDPMHTYFKSQQARYQRCWFTNSARKGQAKLLFTTLLSQNSGYDYYKTTLKTILDTQANILAADSKTTYNKKGHSRLFNITQSMFVHVARAYLLDQNVPASSRTDVQKILNKQFSVQLENLIKRLPQEHPLKDKLTVARGFRAEKSYSEDHQVRDSVQKILAETKLSTVPRHLRYLVDNLSCHVNLNTDVQSAFSA